jgi:hypothetical protein
MCLFSGAVERVSGTQIFARRLEGGRQALAYEMTVAATEPVAMCLPLPVAPGSGEDAVTFIDLSRYGSFFEDCATAFPVPQSVGMLASRGGFFSELSLAVHTVGDFVASYVPSPNDFARLDPRFRLSPAALAQMPQYADYGFAVFQLAQPRPKPARAKRPWWQFWKSAPPAPTTVDANAPATIHPMAFTFPSRHADALYFPTLHLHDGDHVPPRAAYDHTLYCQTTDARLAKTLPWTRSPEALGKSVATGKTGGLVAGDAHAYRLTLHGELKNVDHLFVPPTCTPAALSVRDAHFAFDLAARAAYDIDPMTDRDRARQATARARLDELSAGLAAGLRTLCGEHAEAWELGAFPKVRADEPVYPNVMLSNGALMLMTELGPRALEPGTGGTVIVPLTVETDRVERQQILVAFRTAPTIDTVTTIEAALPAIVDRALA